MQQSEALYFLNSLFNFIVQKQKILKITSNLRIGLDLFEMINFGTNYGLQTADKAITGSTKVAVRFFGPFLSKRSLELIDTLVFFSGNLILKNGSGTKAQRLRYGDFGGHCAVEIKQGTSF